MNGNFESHLKNVHMLLNLRGRLVSFNSPVVMGIVNLTPDSFYDGGQFNSTDKALLQCEQMLNEGATILDIGGMSSRPGAQIISAEEETARILPLLQQLVLRFPEAIVSVDTLHAFTAQQALETGVHIINDISAGTYDANMLSTVAQYQAVYVAMHMQGTPASMQHQPVYNEVCTEVVQFLAERKNACRLAGIKDVIADPGFGFGKTLQHNYTLLNQLERFKMLNMPLLVGLSRKSMVTKLLGISAAEALNGTTALHTIALLKGANILRVHDVKEALQTIKIVQELQA